VTEKDMAYWGEGGLLRQNKENKLQRTIENEYSTRKQTPYSYTVVIGISGVMNRGADKSLA